MSQNNRIIEILEREGQIDNKESENDWAQIESFFDWAEQIKGYEIERWKVMYGITPAKFIAFLKSRFIPKKQLSDAIEGLSEVVWSNAHQDYGYRKALRDLKETLIPTSKTKEI